MVGCPECSARLCRGCPRRLDGERLAYEIPTLVVALEDVADVSETQRLAPGWRSAPTSQRPPCGPRWKTTATAPSERECRATLTNRTSAASLPGSAFGWYPPDRPEVIAEKRDHLKLSQLSTEIMGAVRD